MNMPVLLGIAAVLVASGVVPVYAGAEDDALLRIATQAYDEIRAQMGGAAEAAGEIDSMLLQGAGELGLLREAVADGNTQEAKRHFLSAMGIFKQVSHMISAGGPAAAPQAADLKSELDRAEKFLTSLKGISQIHGSGVDFGELDGLFELARQQMGGGDASAARDTINRINPLLVGINSELRQMAQEMAADRARQFAQQYLDRLDKIIEEARELGQPEEVIGELEDARETLSGSSDPKEIIEEIRRVTAIAEGLDPSRFDEMALRVDAMEKRLDELASTGGADPDRIEDARIIISEIRSSMEKRDYGEAQSLLEILADTMP